MSERQVSLNVTVSPCTSPSMLYKRCSGMNGVNQLSLERFLAARLPNAVGRMHPPRLCFVDSPL
jgi:hypothetical protein